MPDAADMADEIVAEHLARGLRAAAVPIAAGVAGECEGCGEEMPRLVDGRCGFCRDGRRRAGNPIGRAPAVFMEEVEMGTKTIGLASSRGAAIAALDRYVKEHEVSLGTAAADLIERGALAWAAPLREPSLDDLPDQVRDRFAAQEQASVDGAIAEATARAEAAEAALARIKAALA